MTDLAFSDANISTIGTFAVNGYTISAPIFTNEEAEKIVGSITWYAAEYFDGSYRAFETLTKSYALWADPNYPLRQKALPILSGISGFSEDSIICFGLEPLGQMVLELDTLTQLHTRLIELVESGRFAQFTRWQNGHIKGYGIPKLVVQKRPAQIVHNVAGNVVGASWLSTMLGAIAQARQFVKLPFRDLASFMFYLQTVGELDPAFRDTIACGYYEGGGEVEDDILKASDIVFAMGSDQTMDALQHKLDRLNPPARLLKHGWNLSFHVVGKAYAIPEVAELAAWGAVAHDGNACFSPANVYIERGGRLSPQQFAETMAEHMAALAERIPPKQSFAVAERVTSYRQNQLKRKLLGEDVRVIKSRNTDYTIILDHEDPNLIPTCQERTVIVKPVDDINSVPQYISHLAGNLQTVGLAVPPGDILDIADQLGAQGVTNIRMLGTEYVIDLLECHDGLFNTAQMFMSDDLRWLNVRYTDTDQAVEEALRIKETTLANLAASKERILR